MLVVPCSITIPATLFYVLFLLGYYLPLVEFQSFYLAQLYIDYFLNFLCNYFNFVRVLIFIDQEKSNGHSSSKKM